MPVGSPLELYTVVLGWHIFAGSWDLLANLGLPLIPFCWVIFDNLIEARKQASKTDVGVRAFRRAEVELYMTLFVMFLFSVPNIDLQVQSVTYVYSSCDINGSELERTTDELGFGATRTTYDQDVADSIITVLDGEQPRMPIAWYLITRYLRAIPEAMKATIPCVADLRLLSTDIRNSAIRDPFLRDEFGMFVRDCWRPSINQYFRLKPATPSNIEDITTDVSWAGSMFFLTTNGYYDSFRVVEPLSSFSYDAERDGERLLPEHADGRGMPWCFEWWESASEGLRERLLEDSGLDSNVNARYIYRRIFGSDTTREARDAMLYDVLSADAEFYADRASNTFPRDESVTDIVGGAVRTGVGAIGLAVAAPVMYTSVEVMKQAAPIFQAAMLLLLTAFLGILLLVSGYNLKTAFALMFVMFSFQMWGFIFVLVDWLDNVLWASVNSGGDLTRRLQVLTSADKTMAMFVFDFVIGALYLMAPTAFSVFMGIAGAKSGDSLASSAGSGAKGIGSSGGSGAGMAQTAATKGKK